MLSEDAYIRLYTGDVDLRGRAEHAGNGNGTGNRVGGRGGGGGGEGDEYTAEVNRSACIARENCRLTL